MKNALLANSRQQREPLFLESDLSERPNEEIMDLRDRTLAVTTTNTSMTTKDKITIFREYTGFFKNAAIRRMSSEHRKRMREIRSGLVLPSSPRRLPKGAVAAITMVKNEEDIIEKTVHNMLNQGIDYVLVADNNSDDSTPEILRELAANPRVGLAFDGVAAYFQSEKMGNLAQFVTSLGANWIVPFDADEFWFSEEGTVADFLRASDGTRFPGQVHNAFPATDNSDVLWVDEGFEGLPKTAFRAFPFAYPSMGNHYAVRPGRFHSGLHVIHYPWRSKDQLRRKSRIGSLALKLANAEKGVGIQWTGIRHDNDAAVDRIWESILNRTPDPVLGLSSSGPFHQIDPRNLTQWTPRGQSS